MSVDSSPLPRAGQHLVSSVAQLEALYGEPSPRALAKEVNRVIAPYRAFIAQSPFVLVASGGPEGLDCSPRGDAPGFVRVVDERTLQLPDRRGNNRIDTLRNLVVDPRIALLFLVPFIVLLLMGGGRYSVEHRIGRPK